MIDGSKIQNRWLSRVHLLFKGTVVNIICKFGSLCFLESSSKCLRIFSDWDLLVHENCKYSLSYWKLIDCQLASSLISVHEDECYICGDGGELLMCDKGGCSKCYHKDCLGGDVTTRGKWICPWHFCDDCGKWANILCSECPNSYCKAHTSGQITELGNGIHVCCDHILTRKKTTQNQGEADNDGDDLASAGIE